MLKAPTLSPEKEHEKLLQIAASDEPRAMTACKYCGARMQWIRDVTTSKWIPVEEKDGLLKRHSCKQAYVAFMKKKNHHG